MKDAFFIGVLLGVVATTMVVAGTLSLVSQGALLAAIQAGASVAVAASATVAYRAYRSNLGRHAVDDRRKRSEKYLEESIKLLERAHLIFLPTGAVPPSNDRLLWLTTARFLMRFRHMSERLSEEDHIAIAAENEEFYRLKFRATLDASKSDFTVAYFMPSGALYDATNIARISIAVIFDFAKWRPGAEDPLGLVNEKQLLAQGAVPDEFDGVTEYLQRFEQFWADVQAIKQGSGGGAT